MSVGTQIIMLAIAFFPITEQESILLTFTASHSEALIVAPVGGHGWIFTHFRENVEAHID